MRSNMTLAKFGLMDRVVAGLYNNLCVFTCVHEVKNLIENIDADAWMTVLAHYLLLIRVTTRGTKASFLFQLHGGVIFPILCFKCCVTCGTKICKWVT